MEPTLMIPNKYMYQNYILTPLLLRLEIFTAVKIHVMVFSVKVEVTQPSKTLVTYHITTWNHNPDNHDMNSYHFFTLKECKVVGMERWY